MSNATAKSVEEIAAELTLMFGSGRYSPLMKSVFTGLQEKFGVSEKVAKTVAEQVGRDYGDYMKKATPECKIGKINSENRVTLSEAAKVKGAYVTHALLAMRSLQWIGESLQNGVSYADTKWTPNKVLAAYFNSIENPESE